MRVEARVSPPVRPPQFSSVCFLLSLSHYSAFSPQSGGFGFVLPSSARAFLLRHEGPFCSARARARASRSGSNLGSSTRRAEEEHGRCARARRDGTEDRWNTNETETIRRSRIRISFRLGAKHFSLISRRATNAKRISRTRAELGM